MFTSAFIELRESRKELLHVLHEHSLSLAETITNSSSNIILATDQIEEELSVRLLNNAYLIARLDSLRPLNRQTLKDIAGQNAIYRINIFDRYGERILSSHTPEEHAAFVKEKYSPKKILQPILQGKTDRLVIGLKEARFEEGQRYAVAVRRTNPSGGAIVLNLDAANFLDFRKKVGIGKLIQDLGNNSGIEYVAIQDLEGILAATKDVQEISSIDNDDFLRSILEQDTVLSRETLFGDRPVYEVAKHFSIDGEDVGVLRIGLSMDELRAADERMRRRVIIMALVIAALGVIIVSFIVATQNLRLLSGKYEAIQTFSGNILEHMYDAVITMDSTQRITIFNRQAELLFDIAAHEIIGKPFASLPNNLQACLQSVFTWSESQSERSLRCKSNEERIVLVSLSATQSSDGTRESSTAVIRDLTEAKRLEKEIQRKEKMTAMGHLAAGVAHEIRNPLNAISMIAQRYEKEFAPKKGVKEYHKLTGVLKKETLRVNRIIQQFLSFARPHPVQITEIPSVEFISHVATLFKPQADNKEISFTWDAEKIILKIDPEQMTQAVLNLLQNALDATPKEGSITLRLLKTKTEAHIEVSDTGSGIAPELQQRIFNLYYTTKTTGTGMGLAITQQIISQHNGSLDLKNHFPMGTVFTISIPL